MSFKQSSVAVSWHDGKGSATEMDTTPGRLTASEPKTRELLNTRPTTSRGLFITGTDTNVGKTHVTCLIARQLIAAGIVTAAYKPVCSGAVKKQSALSPGSNDVEWEDLVRLSAATNGKWSDETICPQRFFAPLAPPIAAKMEGRIVDFQLLVDGARKFPDAEVLLVEGAGGWLSPLTESATVADLAQELKLPILIVARAGLGTINHTLLTIESVRARGLPIAGIVLNEVVPAGEDISFQTNGNEIQSRGGAPVLGIVHHGAKFDLHQGGQSVTIYWQSLAGPMAEIKSSK
jgi:dethiobiotin synthetase